MAAVTEDTLTKVSTDAATDFVQSFYSALQSARPTISSFYSQPSASILFNGNAVADGAAVQDIFMNQMPSTYYEVQSYDCQVLNPSYPTAAGLQPDIQGRPRGGAAAARNMSILVLVSGYVRFGEGKESFDTPNRGFSETFVLVPNPQADGGFKGRGKKHWLIQSQNFRLVV
ncbi:hypothetical protein DIZ76_011884 [Coccidioides immitis]|uniref:NTF2 domain-containing protein n=2 Tax=Coccidioides posadasii TaxID=199306 RepID=A0A0J6FPE2_COCPO|nr:Nuclear transport factor 2 domain containing protein [Coccidioides posadasii C735 delta SOWgp]EER25334.1 Nuclear transport factor 2 domain containing protein [Coccidioides posadasii C735 delta SOWgp]KMM72238.1 hypothetical protein CPAG_08535 [Coccidioides posadasii RMSCC 3488]TPX26422.1 hypothetical protein DIZ76_011884 [Coccidioides immitis]|eukprot:XP_003067479.1 Nuclear transport factor 2 domain containing protein [Coccidioides posadasii C735 delta SOWgp]